MPLAMSSGFWLSLFYRYWNWVWLDSQSCFETESSIGSQLRANALGIQLAIKNGGDINYKYYVGYNVASIEPATNISSNT
jgi:hypothetical protein